MTTITNTGLCTFLILIKNKNTPTTSLETEKTTMTKEFKKDKKHDVLIGNFLKSRRPKD